MSFISDITDYIEAAGLGTAGTDLFESRMPVSPNNTMAVINTGGEQPSQYIETQNNTIQVLIRNQDYNSGEIKMNQIIDLLHQLYNTQLTNYYLYYCLLSSEGGHLGQDEEGREMFSVNFRTMSRRSNVGLPPLFAFMDDTQYTYMDGTNFEYMS